MFQTYSNQKEDAGAILKQELEFFDSVLQFSKKFMEQVPSLPINVLSNMVNYRQEWIEQIKQLEDRRKRLPKRKQSAEEKKYLKEISSLAEQLVEIDKSIYRNLEQRKLKFVQEHSAMTAQGRYNLDQAKKQSKKKSRLDIIRE